MVDTRNAGQGVANILTLVFVFGADFDVVPVAHHGEGFVVVLQNVTNVPGQRILIKRKRTDWLLMVISGNNLMINFMAVFVVR